MEKMEIKNKENIINYDKNIIEYEKKEGSVSSYIVFGIDDSHSESVELKMIENNNIPGILFSDFRYEDNRLYLYYDITNKTSLSENLERQKITYSILNKIYSAVLQVISNCEKYLISIDSILFMQDLIYVSREYNNIEFCVLPECKKSFRKQIKNLTEELMKITDHGDKKGVGFVYGMYEIVSNDTFHINDIKEFISENGLDFYGDKDEKIYRLQGIGKAREIGKDREIGKGKEIGRDREISKDMVISDVQNTFKEQRVSKVPKFIEKNNINDENNNMSKMEYFSLVRESAKKIFLREFVPEIIRVKKSVSFGGGAEGIMYVGRDKSNEVILPHKYISRKHAMLEADENFLYVTDKGSSNGTFVNGEKIAANVKTRCRVQDEITFADISFIVI